VALGKGIEAPHWLTAKPYQPTSPEFIGATLGLTGPVWIDGVRDGERTTPRGYAEKLIKDVGANGEKLAKALSSFDAAVAVQTTHLYLQNQKSPAADEVEKMLQSAQPAAAKGIRAAWQAYREQELARARLDSK